MVAETRGQSEICWSSKPSFAGLASNWSRATAAGQLVGNPRPPVETQPSAPAVPLVQLERKELSRRHGRLMADCEKLTVVERQSLVNSQVDPAIYETYLKRNLKDHPDCRPLTASSHTARFKLLVTAEHAYNEIDLRRYDQSSLEVERIGPLRCNRLTFPNLYKSDLNLLPCIHNLLLDSKRDGSLKLAHIVRAEGEQIYFKVGATKAPTGFIDFPGWLPEGNYGCRIVSSSQIWDRAQEALVALNRKSPLQRALFNRPSWRARERRANDQIVDPEQQEAEGGGGGGDEGFKLVFKFGSRNGFASIQGRPKINLAQTSDRLLNKRLAKLNTRQYQAVCRILEANCRPGPYILFGPPGTGKTRTLVELILQIYKRDKQSTILVTSSANNCADKLADDLHETGYVKSLRRLTSVSNSIAEGNYFAIEVEWNQHRRFKQPDTLPDYYCNKIEEACRYRVVVTTNNMAGSRRFNGTFFDWVIVDEAGHASEPETIISMVRCKPDGCIVLPGDPEQLGPIIKCNEAKKLGLGKSLLVRLTRENNNYKYSNGFDPTYSTRLVECYRSDPRILALSNRLFYHGELKCRNETPAGLMQILQLKNPNMFISVPDGQMSCEDDSYSVFNNQEIDVCIEQILQLYKIGIEPNQLGLITPYKLHKLKLIERFRERLKLEEDALNRRFQPGLLNGEAAQSRAQVQLATLHSLVESARGGEEDSMKKLRWHLERLIRKAPDYAEGKELELTKRLRLLMLRTDGDKTAIDFAQRHHELELFLREIVRKSMENADESYWMCKIDTVDGFQGGEREIILISLVKAPSESGLISEYELHFINDPHRFNVSITRAMWFNIVIGHKSVAQVSEFWAQYLEGAQILEPGDRLDDRLKPLDSLRNLAAFPHL